MNLAQAVAVCLYELARGSSSDPEKIDEEPATAAVNEQITECIFEALDKSGYVKPGNHAVSEKKVRRLVLRLGLSAGDAKVFLGMVRQIVWKLHQK